MKPNKEGFMVKLPARKQVLSRCSCAQPCVNFANMSKKLRYEQVVEAIHAMHAIYNKPSPNTYRSSLIRDVVPLGLWYLELLHLAINSGILP
jgi:hypothetical protein